MREIDSTTPVDEVMRTSPGTIRAFLDHRMNCPGCQIACFHTVADACREHHLDPGSFLVEQKRLSFLHPRPA